MRFFDMMHPPTTCDSMSCGHLGYPQEHDASFAWLLIVDANTSNKTSSGDFQIDLLGQLKLHSWEFLL